MAIVYTLDWIGFEFFKIKLGGGYEVGVGKSVIAEQMAQSRGGDWHNTALCTIVTKVGLCSGQGYC